jgi:hypothetical protein
LKVSENLVRGGTGLKLFQRPVRGGKKVEVHEELVGRDTQTEGTTVKLTYNGNARDRNIFRCREVPFHTGRPT